MKNLPDTGAGDGMKNYFVYILASNSRKLYVGVTNDLQRRVFEHKNRITGGFTSKYNINTLVYFEQTPDIEAAIRREKQLKGWSRSKKIALIEDRNPYWDDLSEKWFAENGDSAQC